WTTNAGRYSSKKPGLQAFNQSLRAGPRSNFAAVTHRRPANAKASTRRRRQAPDPQPPRALAVRLRSFEPQVTCLLRRWIILAPHPVGLDNQQPENSFGYLRQPVDDSSGGAVR